MNFDERVIVGEEVTNAPSGVARLEWARVQRFQKGPVVPLTGFVCSTNKQSPYSGDFWVGGRPNRPKVCHTSKCQRFPVISDETNYQRFKKYFLINRMQGSIQKYGLGGA